jgi:hypothetical protein
MKAPDDGREHDAIIVRDRPSQIGHLKPSNKLQCAEAGEQLGQPEGRIDWKCVRGIC